MIKKFNSIIKEYEANHLKEGLNVETDGDGNSKKKGKKITGIIGEIDVERKEMFIWSNSKNGKGTVGNKNPKAYGYKYSWMVTLNNEDAKIRIDNGINELNEFSQNQKLNNLEAILKKHENN